LIYATSNRRHLIREQFSDNPGAGEQDEIAAWDTVEEKLSLSDRFGLMITFVSPSQQKFLQIVFTLAERAGIKLEREELTRRALQWVMGHSGRSGRVARQFIDHLTGQTALSQKDTR
jgi:predicted AAA+ superfamily ATPase